MKLLPTLTAGSLLLNAVFIGILASRLTGSAPQSDVPVGVSVKVAGVFSAAPPHATDGINAGTWSELAAAEPAALAESLRDQGYPPTIIRAIVRARVRGMFAGRYRQLVEQAATVPYWRGSVYNLSADPKVERARRALDREVAEKELQLLGSTGGDLSDTERRQLRRQYGDLDPAKAAELQRISADYDDLIAEIRGTGRGVMLPADAQTLAFLEQEKRADQARLLSPEELEKVDLRSTPTAARLRGELSAFGASEDEFRALFRIQHAFDTQYGVSGDLTDDQRRARAEAQKNLIGQISTALGPERFADYQRTTDPTWMSASRFVAQLGLPSATTNQIVAVQREITARATAIRTDQGLTPAQQQARIASLAQEANSRLQPALGDSGLDAYKQNSGQWLRALQNAGARPLGAP